MTKSKISVNFARMEGLGNKIIVLDLRDKPYFFEEKDFSNFCCKIGKDFDQLMVIYDVDQDIEQAIPEYFIEIWNLDGSKAEACGNGTRCVMAYLYYHKGLKAPNFEAILHIREQKLKGKYLVHNFLPFVKKEANQEITSVELPAPCFDKTSIGLNNDMCHGRRLFFGEYFFKEEMISFGVDRRIKRSVFNYPEFLSVGNPHAIFFIDRALGEIGVEDLLIKIGPKLENASYFTKKCNISLVHINSRKTLSVRTWERGAGLTKACGTGACASVVAARLRHLIDEEVIVHLYEGQLLIRWSGQKASPIFMSGPCRFISHEMIDLPVG